MDYFVSAEDSVYYHWQLELLLESFHMHGLEDRLVIALAETHAPCHKDFRRRLNNHKRLFLHKNEGRSRNFVRMNKQFGLATALQNNIIQSPYTVIDPDMVLVQPVTHPSENITFQTDPELVATVCESKGCDINRHIRERLPAEANGLWLPIGNVFALRDIPKEIATRALGWTQTFLNEASFRTPERWKYMDRVGWAMAMLEFYGHISYRATFDLEITLLHNAPCHFIHYTHGLPPVFSKYMFRYEPPDIFSGDETPYHALLKENPTTSTNYVRKIAERVLYS